MEQTSLINMITIEALSVYMGFERRNPWPIFLIEAWLSKNKKYFNKADLGVGLLPYRKALITALGCYMNFNFKDAEILYYKIKNNKD